MYKILCITWYKSLHRSHSTHGLALISIAGDRPNLENSAFFGERCLEYGSSIGFGMKAIHVFLFYGIDSHAPRPGFRCRQATSALQPPGGIQKPQRAYCSDVFEPKLSSSAVSYSYSRSVTNSAVRPGLSC